MLNKIKVGLSFSDDDFELAESLALELKKENYSVISDNTLLNEKHHLWGASQLELIDQNYSKYVNYTIVILSKSFHTDKWAKFRRCKILESVIQTEGSILPIKVGDVADIDGITSGIQSLNVNDTGVDEIVRIFKQKVGLQIQTVADPFIKYQNISGLIKLYNEKLEVSKVDSVKESTQKVAFELYEAKDLLSNQHFLFIYGGSTIINVKAILREKYKNYRDFIILLPKEKAQKNYSVRLANVKEKLGIDHVFYIDEFVWDICTSKEFKEDNSKYDVPIFIDPFLDKAERVFAESYIMKWLTKENSPSLIITGEGGIGKTTLSKKVANEYINRIGKRVIFIDTASILGNLVNEASKEANKIDIYSLYRAACISDNWGHLLNPQLFNANLDAGNFLIIIDGLEEVTSSLGNSFDVNHFFESIEQSCTDAKQTKILVTSREIGALSHISSDKIELLPFDKELAKEYFSHLYPNLPSLVKKGLQIASSLMKGEDIYIPFVLDVVSYVLKEEVEDNCFSADPLFNTTLLSKDIVNDYIIFKVCSREKKKYPFALSPDEQIELLIKFAVKHGGATKVSSFKEIINQLKGTTVDSVFLDALLAHPLLICDQNIVKLKYDLFSDYFESIYLSHVLNNIKPLSTEFIDILARKSRYDSSFLAHVNERVIDRDNFELSALNIIEQAPDYTDSREQLESLVSGVFKLYLESSGNNLNKENVTNTAKDLFGNGNNLSGLSLVYENRKILFDFSGLHILSCSFVNYEHFWESKFDENTYFSNTRLINLPKHNSITTSATRTNFDLNTCSIDSTVNDVINKKEEKLIDKKIAFGSDVSDIIKMFYDRGHFVPRKYEMIKAKYKGITMINVIIELLIENEIIINYKSDKSKKMGLEYAINKSYSTEALKFFTEEYMSTPFRKLLESI